MRDVEHARPGTLDFAHEAVQALDLVVGKDGGGLVEHQEPAAALPSLKRAGDGHHRSFNGGRLCQRQMDVELDAEPSHQASSLPRLLSPENTAASASSEAVPQREVVHRVQLEDESEILVDEAKALARRVFRVTERERLTVELRMRARVRLVVAGEHFDQRRLTGAVLADQRMNFPGQDLERCLDEGSRAAEGLRKPLDAEDRDVGLRVLRAALLSRENVLRHGTWAARGVSPGIGRPFGIERPF